MALSTGEVPNALVDDAQVGGRGGDRGLCSVRVPPFKLPAEVLEIALSLLYKGLYLKAAITRHQRITSRNRQRQKVTCL